MKRILLKAMILLCASFAVALEEYAMRLDCSDEKKMQESIVGMMTKLDDTKQQQFVAAIATIGVLGMQGAEGVKPMEIRDMLNGKTADEVIALARRMTPYIKGNKTIVDGSSADNFSKSIGEIMISLEEMKRARFSEAIAKIMYLSQQKKEKLDELAKRLDGKTADEIIALGLGESSPLPAGVKTIKEYELSPVTTESAEKYLNRKRAEPEPSYAPSLAPNSNY